MSAGVIASACAGVLIIAVIVAILASALKRGRAEMDRLIAQARLEKAMGRMQPGDHDQDQDDGGAA